MDNKCPKCGKKLRLFYIKENCPECGANIMYYNMEERLELDAQKAEAEYEKLNAILDKITPKFIKKRKEAKAQKNSEESIGVDIEE